MIAANVFNQGPHALLRLFRSVLPAFLFGDRDGERLLQPASSASSASFPIKAMPRISSRLFLASLCARYGLEMKPDTVRELVQRFQLLFPGEPVGLSATG
jgi:hypothetical protein